MGGAMLEITLAAGTCLLSPFLSPCWESIQKRGLFWHVLGLLESTNVLFRDVEVLFCVVLGHVVQLHLGQIWQGVYLEQPISPQPLVGSETLRALLASTGSVGLAQCIC